MALNEIPGVQKPVVRYARSKGWLCWKMEIVGINGCPDYWFFKAGRTVIIEFKKPGKEPTVQQVRRANELREHGFEVHVIDDAATGKALFDEGVFDDLLG